jgi:hypothetical protein
VKCTNSIDICKPYDSEHQQTTNIVFKKPTHSKQVYRSSRNNLLLRISLIFPVGLFVGLGYLTVYTSYLAKKKLGNGERVSASEGEKERECVGNGSELTCTYVCSR